MKNILKKAGIGLVCLCMVLTFTACIIPEPEYVEVQVEEGIFEEQYHYQQYDEEDKLVYREIYQGLINHEEAFTVHGMNPDDTNQIFLSVLRDFPEIFWSDGAANATGYEFPEHVVFEPTYVCSKTERDKREKEIQAEAEKILAGVPANATDYDKIKYVYETIVDQVTYVDEAPDNQNIYSALVRKESVCAGYAKETQYLLESLGIPCIYVIGEATNDEETMSHAWNIVCCDGKYYNVDTTWGDPLPNEEEKENQSDVGILYDYLCCSDAQLEATHVREKKIDYPKCDSEDLNYYRLNNLYYETADRQTLLNAMKQTINQKGEQTIFKFANSDLYEQASKLLVDELLDTASEYLGKRYRKSYVECMYRENPENYTFEIEWKY